MSDPRNVAIAGLTALVLLLAAALLWERSRALGPVEPPPAEETSVVDREAVSVIDVVLDRESLQRVDLIFDRPLGDDRVGESLGRDPATLSPRVGGVWSWVAANVLRFTPTSRLTPATRYEIALQPDRLLGAGQVLVGEPPAFQTDAFQVERFDAGEEPDPSSSGRVTLRGEIRFNYRVDPRELSRRLRLVDSSRGDAPIAVTMETSYARATLAWRSASVEKSPEERDLLLTIVSDLTSANGNVPLAADYTRTIALGSSERLSVRGVQTKSGEKASTLTVELSSPVDAGLAVEYLDVEPPVEFRASDAAGRLALRGAFLPGESYTLSIRAGLPARDGALLPEAFTQRVDFAQLEPRAGFQSAGMFLAATGSRRLALETVNVDRVTLTVDRVFRNNVLYLAQQRSYQVWRERGSRNIERVFGNRVAEQELRIEGPRNRTAVTAVDLDDVVDLDEPGFYRVGLRRPGSYNLVQRWILVTDLGLVVKRGAGDVLVWASSFGDLAPLAGVQVRVVSDQNQTLAEGRTAANGLLHLRGLEAVFAEQRPAWVVAERGGDWSFLPLERSRVDTSGLDVGGATAGAGGYDAYLYGERDLYRPGETARGVTVIRDRSLGTPPAMPAVLRHRNPEGQLRESWRVNLDDDGVAEWSHAIPEAARTGGHVLELVIGEDVVGRYRFQVEEFVPDRIRVGIEPGGERPATGLTPGTPLAYRVDAAYLFGPPAAGLPVETRVRLEPAAFAPAQHEGFVFSNADRSFSAREILSREETLDDAGRAAFEVTVPAGLEPPAALQAVVRARVRERGGRGVAAERRFTVHPHARYVGLRRRGEGYAEPGQPVAFEWVAVTPEGQETTAARLRAELFRLEWHTVLRRTPSGSYRYHPERDERLVESRAVEAGVGRGRFELTPDDYGSYRVVLSDPDGGASAALQFYASGWGFAPWAVENPGRVELDLEQDDFAPGERALVQVRAPFAGRLLLTVEREGVLHQEVHSLEGNTARIPITLRGDYRPNVYVTATLVRDADDLEPGAVARAFGAVSVNVDRLRHRLPVAIEAAEEMRGGGRLELRVRTRPGAKVTVAAVDEGILQLVAQETPDPFAHFYRKRALGVTAHDIFSLLLPELSLEKAAPAGGGRADEARAQLVRTEGIRRVKPVAFWSGLLEADASGLARASFALPEFQGALRVMAVAHQGPDFGAESTFTRVRDPLVLLPTFPRFLATGDRVELPVTARNDTGRSGPFEIALEASGPVTPTDPATAQAEIADAAEATVFFPLEAGAATGDVSLVVSAAGGGESARATGALGVRPALPSRSVEQAGSLSTGLTRLEGEATAGLRAESLRRSLRVGPTPLVELHGQLGPLLRYPYGCLEQTVSRALPLLTMAPLARALEPELFEDHDPDALVAEATRRVGAMQISNGGFALWPRGREADPWASVYATHFLVEARRAGHEVAGGLADAALRHVRGEAVAKPRYSGPELERTVYALYVLSRAGQPDLATMDLLREKHEAKLVASSRALLGAAYAAAGNPGALQELAASVEDAEQVRRQSGGNFSSTARNRALLLLALLDAAPEDPRVEGLARRIARDAQSTRWNTQEAGLSLLALGQLFSRAEQGAVQGEVRVAGRAIGRFDNESTVFPELPAVGAVEIELTAESRGTAWYSLTTRGTPTDASFAPEAEGLEVERRLLDRDGNPLDEMRVRQGDLVVARVRVRSTAGPLENVALVQLLPAGLEVENARLEAAETLPFTQDADLDVRYVDVRDDRLLLFANLPEPRWRTSYALLRAVAPGRFQLPPVQVEAMYEPTLRAVGERGVFEVERRP
ncbi:MAG: MG2 domain-containing protein [Myxococcota bacterium]|nr:MG2 domain-containing protein [Myxococcota bacterium]